MGWPGGSQPLGLPFDQQGSEERSTILTFIFHRSYFVGTLASGMMLPARPPRFSIPAS